jgi:hypothetical protein
MNPNWLCFAVALPVGVSGGAGWANWVCLYNGSSPRLALFVRPVRQWNPGRIESWPRGPAVPGTGIGFVLPWPCTRQIRHNLLSIKHLSLMSLGRELALFRTLGPSGDGAGVLSPLAHSCPSRRIGFVSHGSMLSFSRLPLATSNLKLACQLALFVQRSSHRLPTTDYRPPPLVSCLLPFHFLPLTSVDSSLIPAMLHESVERNGFRRLPKPP